MKLLGHEWEVVPAPTVKRPAVKRTVHPAAYRLPGESAARLSVAPTRRRPYLQARLLTLDAVGTLGAWSAVLLGVRIEGGSGQIRLGAALGLLLTVALLAMAVQRLYLTRVCAIRTIELRGLARSTLVTGVLAAFLLPHLGLVLSLPGAAAASALMFGLLAGLRSLYSSWLSLQRARGEFLRPLVLIGTNGESRELLQLLESQPELGYQVVGVIGGDEQEAQGMRPPWLGDLGALPDAVPRGAADALVAVTSFDSDEVTQIVRRLLQAGMRVHTSSGLRRVDRRRIRVVPVGHEPLFYIEPARVGAWQRVAKRGLDLLLGSFLLLAATPVLVLSCLAIWVESGRPFLFRQARTGRNGSPFSMLKLRTMVTDAAEQLDGLRSQNERRDGPLFKMEEDPRVTKVGRFLRATSIDELPQLANVLRGEMSLVGPRPALPDEVAQFDEELLARFGMRPGITGLWQVEARDSPSFAAYRHLDLFYVENWTLTMDLSILAQTGGAVLLRMARTLEKRRGGRRLRASEQTGREPS